MTPHLVQASDGHSDAWDARCHLLSASFGWQSFLKASLFLQLGHHGLLRPATFDPAARTFDPAGRTFGPAAAHMGSLAAPFNPAARTFQYANKVSCADAIVAAVRTFNTAARTLNLVHSLLLFLDHFRSAHFALAPVPLLQNCVIQSV